MSRNTLRHNLEVQPLHSSSAGNATRVSSNSTTLLIDCGVSRRALYKQERFDVDAVFVTHAHTDHISGAGVLGRDTGAKIYIHHESLEYHLARNPGFFKGCDVNAISEGDSIHVDGITVTSHATSHDVPGSVYYTVYNEENDARFGQVTDTGVILPDMGPMLDSCDALLLESNHDVDMLKAFTGYPETHKKRIRGRHGHLSNEQVLQFLEGSINLDTKQWIAFGHLSPRTNDPRLVLGGAQQAFPLYDGFAIAPSDSTFFIRSN